MKHFFLEGFFLIIPNFAIHRLYDLERSEVHLSVPLPGIDCS